MTAEPLAPQPAEFLSLLGHRVRWGLLQALARGDQRVQELVQLLGEPQNLVSYHLKQLRLNGLVAERRSAADQRDVYYTARLDEIQRLYQASGDALHPALTASPSAEAQPDAAQAAIAPVRALFLCTHNSARSQMAEALLRYLSRDRVETFSAGTHPSQVHPMATRVMAERGIDISAQRSKDMGEFWGQKFDYVVTVCDQASESCPIFPGDPVRIHWSFADPSAVEGEDAQLRAFRQTATELTTRLNNLLLLVNRRK